LLVTELTTLEAGIGVGPGNKRLPERYADSTLDIIGAILFNTKSRVPVGVFSL
jgi:hypothetical protein